MGIGGLGGTIQVWISKISLDLDVDLTGFNLSRNLMQSQWKGASARLPSTSGASLHEHEGGDSDREEEGVHLADQVLTSPHAIPAPFNTVWSFTRDASRRPVLYLGLNELTFSHASPVSVARHHNRCMWRGVLGFCPASFRAVLSLSAF